jgi:hypothetical protein
MDPIKRKTPTMAFTLIDRKGFTMQFYFKEVAEMYQSFRGGIVIDNNVLQQVEQKEVVNA